MWPTTRRALFAASLLAGCNSTPVASLPEPDASADATVDAGDAGGEGGVDESGVDSSVTDANGTDASDSGSVLNDATPTDGADGDAGPCTDTLANLNATFGVTCPATYDGAVAPAFTCSIFGAPAVFAGSCGGLAAVAYSYGNHWKVCVYDGVDAGSLVGIGAENDIDSFCNQTAATVTAGQVPDACMTMTSNVSPVLSELDASCPAADAATDAAGDGGDAGAD
jgi:hypothetical protein